MRIMHVIDSLNLGGAERMLVEIANQASDDGHAVSVCVTRQGTTLEEALRPGIRVLVLDRRRRFDWTAMGRFATEVRNSGVDILHVHGRSTFSFVALSSALRYIRIPIILHDHYGSIEVDPSVPLWFRHWGARYVSHYVGVYEKLAAWAQEAGVLPGRISVMGNVLDLSRIERGHTNDLRAQLGIGQDKLLGIVVGNVRWEKGTDLLVEALAASSESAGVRILLVGREDDCELAEACRSQSLRLGIRESLVFLGERTDVPDLLHSVDFAVMPARSESGPLVLIEYMAAGLPFVATRVGDVGHRVAALGVPEFVTPGNPDELAAGLRRLVSLSHSERIARGDSGKRVAFDHLDIRKVMSTWYNIYESTIRTAVQ